jgi:16S rRNA U516 pseudouridylate synthase RsuA-like enzyme
MEVLSPGDPKFANGVLINLGQAGKSLFFEPMTVGQPRAGLADTRASDSFIIDRSNGTSLIEVVMGEGRKRIVRRMMDAVGHPVRRLVRTAIGAVRDGNLAPGTYRTLTIDEIRGLYVAGKDTTDG